MDHDEGYAVLGVGDGFTECSDYHIMVSLVSNEEYDEYIYIRCRYL